MSMPMNSPAIGSEVYTMDGDKLGTVKEIQGAYFKVDAPMSMDYWLACECVRGGSLGDRTEVSFAKSELDTYKKDMDKKTM